MPGATITIDGASTHSNVQGAFKLDNVKPGRHEIKATAAGFRADARMVSVNHGALEAVTFTLRRADATSQHSAPQPLTPQRSMQPRKLGQDRADESFDKDH